ncbi:protein NrdI [Bacillus phage BvP]
MLITYESKTGNVRRFIHKVEKVYSVSTEEITESTQVNEPFVHVTYTTGFGQVPESTLKFIENNKDNLIGVAASGNRNWGDSYGLAGDKLSQAYSVPLLHKFEMSGTAADLEKFITEVKYIGK